MSLTTAGAVYTTTTGVATPTEQKRNMLTAMARMHDAAQEYTSTELAKMDADNTEWQRQQDTRMDNGHTISCWHFMHSEGTACECGVL